MMPPSIVEALVARIRKLETSGRAEIAGGLQALLFVSLPAAGQPGRVVFVTDGRKLLEGIGAGTGTPAYDDGVAWRRTSDDTTVAV
jgi:hypothetical protein